MEKLDESVVDCDRILAADLLPLGGTAEPPALSIYRFIAASHMDGVNTYDRRSNREK